MASLVYGRWAPSVETTLPDLEGCFEDIWTARDLGARLEAELESQTVDYTLQDALSTALLVRYVRCFTTGKRLRLSPMDNGELSAEEQQLHERARDIRDKHIAHPVNMLETQSAYVGFISTPEKEAHATVVSAGTRTGISLSLTEVRALLSICTKWLHWLQSAMHAECQRLLPFAQRLTPEELLSLPRGPVEPALDPKRTRRRLSE